MNPEVLNSFEASRRALPPAMFDGERISLQSCGQLAQDLRTCLEGGVGGHERLLLNWVCSLQEREDSMKLFGLSSRLAVFMQMIELVMLAERLRSAGRLREVMHRSMLVALPPDMHDLADTLLKRVQKMDKGKISRGHLTLDVAFMLHERVCSRTAPQKVRYLMWDSSPQFGRDYQMCLVREAEVPDLASMLRHVQALHDTWKTNDGSSPNFDDEDAQQLELHHMGELQRKLRSHALPSVLIGFGAASFSHKVWALLHAARLECFSAEGLCDWASSVLSVASDYGVERLLVDMQDVCVAEVAGWFEDTSLQDMSLIVSGPRLEANAAAPAHMPQDAEVFEDPNAAPQLVDVNAQAIAQAHAEDEDEAFADPPDPLRLSFPCILGIPGLHHIIDNCTKGLGDTMQRYKDNIFLAQQVCRFLRKRDTRTKVLQRCFSHGAGIHMADDIRKFEGWINTDRWGTVAFSIPELLKVKHALVSCWDEARFIQGELAPDDLQGRSTRELAQHVSQAVHDPVWWGWLSMLEMVCNLLREHTAWVEGCSCHYEILRSHKDELSQSLREQFLKCPMRGLRAAELSSGEFLDILRRLWAVSAVQVLRVLPANLTRPDRTLIMQEFDCARAHLAFYFTLKLTHLQEMPWKILQVSHSNEVVAQLAAQEALSSACRHPLVAKLQGTMKHACEGWLAGESLMGPGKTELQQFIAPLRFIPISERPIEGQHAKMHRHGTGRPNHTEHYQSYFVRCSEMARAIETGGLTLENFAWYAQCARNHHKACASVGLCSHPSLALDRQGVRRNRDTMMSCVIYHADPFTLYTAAAPDVRMKPGGGAGRGNPLPALPAPDNAPGPLPDGQGVGLFCFCRCWLVLVLTH